ncbi:hypothetical protein M422DRAFT_246653 [Sphaerobolus stellatus SS14]|nr:hypothetical protein M422DRAFT_246653 [Sphaerobolus stellatus SS14]
MPSKSAGSNPRNFLIPRNTKPREDGGDDTFAVVRQASSGPHKTTERALVLRREVLGTGEVVVSKKLSGQEKLKLLADELTKTALRPPVNLEELDRKIDAQLGDDLKNPQTFMDDILHNLEARIPPGSNGKRNIPLTDPRFLAKEAGTRLHNVYLLAGAWRIVRDMVKQLQDLNLNEADVRSDLRNREKVRERYLALFDMVTAIVRLNQKTVTSLVAGTPHYAPYFVSRDTSGGQTEMQFNYVGDNLRKLREIHKSFIDSIVLEMALPNTDYPYWILLSLLHEGTEECKREHRRFNQALWDAVGDFSVTVEVLDALEGPLMGKEGDGWIRNTPISPEYTEFLRRQDLSNRASMDVDSWSSCFKTIVAVKNKETFDRLWRAINQSYKKACGVEVDALWSIEDDIRRPSQWSAEFLNFGGDDDEPDDRAVVLHKKKKNGDKPAGTGRRAIADVSDDEEMPGLMTVSDSSDDYDPVSDATSEAYESEGSWESDFDEAEDEVLQEDLKDAHDEVFGLLDPEGYFEAGKKSSNPFTRMFSLFGGRYFSSDPTLKVNEQSRTPFKFRSAAPGAPRKPSKPPTTAAKNVDADLPGLEPIRSVGTKSQLKKPAPAKAAPNPTTTAAVDSEEELPPLVPPGAKFDAPRKPMNVTIEEVEDEDGQDKKKKKKKKKKSSKRTAEGQTSAPASPAQTKPPAKPSPQQTALKNSLDPCRANNFSQVSLPLPQEAKAQSAHSYLHSEKLATEKGKIKTRPNFPTIFKSEKDKNTKDTEDGKDGKKGFLGRAMKKIHLPKKASELMTRLVSAADGRSEGKKPMKWEQFLRVMRAMGFEYDPSTAGSSVRFDPPDPKDRSITFHKPHPDPTLQRNHLRSFGKKLVKYYGWNKDMFSAFGVEQGVEPGEDVSDEENY